MSLFTGGTLTATPVLLRTTLTLEQLRALAAEQRYEGLPGKGWGSLSDDTKDLGKYWKARPDMARPQVVEASEERKVPNRFLGRYYFDQLDRKAMNRFASAEESDLHAFKAVDVMISALPTENEYVAFVGAGRESFDFRGYVVPGLDAALREGDEGSTVATEASQFGFGDSDFFRWLLYRNLRDPDVGEMRVEFIRELESQDGLARGANILGGADEQRPELLALVSAAGTDFGPVKVRIAHEELDLRVEIQIKFDGSFVVVAGRSYYGDQSGITIAERNLRFVEDVAYQVLPDLLAAYNSDADWPSQHRDQFMADARSALHRTLAERAPDGACTNCGAHL